MCIRDRLRTREYLLNAQGEQPRPLRDLLAPVYFVPESVPADKLFRDMQQKKTHMAVVVDEYGGTSGLVTLEDLLEEIAVSYTHLCLIYLIVKEIKHVKHYLKKFKKSV